MIEERQILHKGGIEYLYHITDTENLESITQSGGLGSWRYLTDNGISVSKPGGDAITHRLDKRYAADDMIHLYTTPPDEKVISDFCNTGRHTDYVVLIISIDAIKLERVRYYNGNPSDKETITYSTASDFLSENDSETISTSVVDIKHFIPLKYINNIPKKYISRISSIHPTAVVFLLDHSRSMSRGTELGGKKYDYMSDAVAVIVNRQIERMLRKCDEDGQITRRYDIAVLGYGDTVYSAWSGALEGRAFVSPDEISRTGNPGDRFRWINPEDGGEESRGDIAVKAARDLLIEWMSQQESQYFYPPTVVHITDGDIPSNHLKDFVLNAESLKKLSSADGQVIFWNLYITPIQKSEFLLPSGDEVQAIANTGGLSLYEASSTLPEVLNERVCNVLGLDKRMSHRTLGVNVTMDTLDQVLDKCLLPE